MTEPRQPDAESAGPLALGRVLDQLVQDGLVPRAEADQIRLSGSRRTGEHPLEPVAARALEDPRHPGRRLDLDALTEWLAASYGQPCVPIDPLRVNVQAVTGVMSYAFAERHRILALEVTADAVTVASADPAAVEWEELLRQTLRGRRVVRVVANPQDIARYTLEFYTMARAVAKAQDAGRALAGLSNFEQLLELGQLKAPDANDAHVVNIVDWLLQYAFDQRASDIHLEPRREQGLVRFRIDGVLHTVYELPVAVHGAVTSRLKVLGRMDVAEKRRPQDGRLKTRSPDGAEVELRLSTLPTVFGEKLVARIFDPEVLLRSFSELGLVGQDYARWQDMVQQPSGIVLVTGPTGSGKTTTLYSTLRQLATPLVNVCTIEDPIEMVEPAFNQMQVQPGIELGFAAGVRALLRQDPDIIMVGEIRDLETAEMAIQAALTGHLVISPLHPNDAPSAITRLLDLGVPPYLIRATVLGIMAQRLVRTLCPHCKAAAPLAPEDWAQVVAPWPLRAPTQVAMPRGCLECRDTGYLGRVGLYELLPMTEPVRAHVSTETDAGALRREGVRAGMRTLRIAGALKVAAGTTTLAEVLRVAPAAER
ncbi:MAG: GspE/PulE family protein [Pseudomonadales bacterium]